MKKNEDIYNNIDMERYTHFINIASQISEECCDLFATNIRKYLKNSLLENVITEEEHHFFYMQFLTAFIKDMLFRLETYGKMTTGNNIYSHLNMLKVLMTSCKLFMKECQHELKIIEEISNMIRDNHDAETTH